MTVPLTMSAAVHDRYGDADVIRVDKVPVPAIGDHDVLVRVEAAGVDRGTWHLLTGQPYLVRLATGVRRPRMAVLGRDVAGTVVATGEAVHRVADGEPAYGFSCSDDRPGHVSSEHGHARPPHPGRQANEIRLPRKQVPRPAIDASSLHAHEIGRAHV